jgi:hypothetical protein
MDTLKETVNGQHTEVESTDVVLAEKQAKVILYADGITMTKKTNQITHAEVEVPDGLVVMTTEGNVTNVEKLPELSQELAKLPANATDEDKAAVTQRVREAVRQAVRATYLVRAMRLFGGQLYQGAKIPKCTIMGKGWGGSVKLEPKEELDTPQSYLARHRAKITAAIDKDTQMLMSSPDICAEFENGII